MFGCLPPPDCPEGPSEAAPEDASPLAGEVVPSPPWLAGCEDEASEAADSPLEPIEPPEVPSPPLVEDEDASEPADEPSPELEAGASDPFEPAADSVC